MRRDHHALAGRIICSLALLALATACGPNGGGEEGTVTIEFWHTFGQGIVDVINHQVEEFQRLVKENEGVDVKINFSYQGGYDDIKNKIDRGFSAGNVPTIAVAYPDHVADYLYAEPPGKTYVTNFADLMHDPEIGFGTDPYLGDEADEDGNPLYDENDIVPAFYEEGTKFVRPGTYTLPYMKSTEVLFYNKEGVEDALRDRDPEFAGTAEAYLNDITWDEFMALNEFVVSDVDENGTSKILSTLEEPLYYDSDANLFITKMFQNNIPYSSIQNGKGVIDFESGESRAKAEDMVKKLKEAYDKKIITTKGVNNLYGSSAFTEEKALFTVGSSGGAGYNLPQSSVFTVGITMVPYDNEPLYVTQGPCLTLLRNPGKSDAWNDLRTKYAWKLIKYLLNPLNNVNVCTAGSQGYVPVRNSCYTTEEYLSFLREGEDFAKTAKVLQDDIDGRYLSTAIFPGSAELRNAVEGIIVQSFRSAKTGTELDDDIHDIFTTAIEKAKLFFH